MVVVRDVGYILVTLWACSYPALLKHGDSKLKASPGSRQILNAGPQKRERLQLFPCHAHLG